MTCWFDSGGSESIGLLFALLGGMGCTTIVWPTIGSKAGSSLTMSSTGSRSSSSNSRSSEFTNSARLFRRRRASFAAGDAHSFRRLSFALICAFKRRFPCTRACSSLPLGSWKSMRTESHLFYDMAQTISSQTFAHFHVGPIPIHPHLVHAL